MTLVRRLAESGYDASFIAANAAAMSPAVERTVSNNGSAVLATMPEVVTSTNNGVQSNYQGGTCSDLQAALPDKDDIKLRRLRIGIDIGGTFTDLVLFDPQSGAIRVEKVHTTPQDLSNGVFIGLSRLDADCHEIALIAHGTTVGLNAFLERKGTPTGLITTKGFRDVYEIGRHNRVDTYDLFYRKPAPLIPRRHRLEVRGRIDASGRIIESLNEDDIQLCVSHFRAHAIRSIAVCLLHSYLNPEHEERVKVLIESSYPEASVTISSAIVRQWREYERTSTTAVNAYIMPAVGHYLDGLEAGLTERGYRRPLFVSQSAGGVISVAAARDKPVHTIMSGPSGGVVAAKRVCADLGRLNAITFDMGGTSTDVAVIHQGKIKVAGQAALDRHPLLVPMIDIQSIGAGGGSIARASATGALEVGPQSAGAIPGPVCYSRGGQEATVTDANLILGRLPAQHFLSATMRLDLQAASAALERTVAQPLELSLIQAALGVLAVINVKMAYAVRATTIERGLDPKEFTLLPFGGAGPMHACAIARHLGISAIVIPVAPGAFSAFGMLASNVRHDFTQTQLAAVDGDALPASIGQSFETMKIRARDTLREEGVTDDNMMFDCTLDMRYVGQEYTVMVPVGSAPTEHASITGLRQDFHRLHEQQYGHASPQEPLEIVDLRVTAQGASVPLHVPRLKDGGAAVESSSVLGEIRAIFGPDLDWLRTPLLDRQALLAGNAFHGPAIVVEPTATTVVDPDFRAEVLHTGELLLLREG